MACPISGTSTTRPSSPTYGSFVSHNRLYGANFSVAISALRSSTESKVSRE